MEFLIEVGVLNQWDRPCGHLKNMSILKSCQIIDKFTCMHRFNLGSLTRNLFYKLSTWFYILSTKLSGMQDTKSMGLYISVNKTDNLGLW